MKSETAPHLTLEQFETLAQRGEQLGPMGERGPLRIPNGNSSPVNPVANF
jgi:hypothetical protein